MTRARHWPHCCVVVVLVVLACSTPQGSAPELRSADPDIVRPPPGSRLKKIPGPMMGPYDSYKDALMAACDRILAKPHATAGRRDHPQFDVRWRVSSEYCAWMYYTPDEKYVVSKLTDQTFEDPALRSKQCSLPPTVDDLRFPPESIKYVFAMHNHLFDDRISRRDINFIVDQMREHGFEVETRHGKIKLSIVAFFANDFEKPTCDGFYQYIPSTHQIVKWTHEQKRWICRQTHLVAWSDDYSTPFVKEAAGPCASGEP